MTKNYKYGRKKEEQIAASLKRKGAKVEVSPGSRGAADVKAKFPTGTQWNIQVKSTRKGEAASPSKKDAGRLKQGATKSNATAVIAKVSPKGVEFTSARTGRTLTPPKRKKKK